jgi:hypothetical protein
MPTYQCSSCRTIFLDQVTSRGICPRCRTMQADKTALPPIECTCPQCGKAYKIPVSSAGTRVPCVKCHAKWAVPAPPGLVTPLSTDPPGSANPLRERLYLVFLLALIPLALDMRGAPDSTQDRFRVSSWGSVNPSPSGDWELTWRREGLP